MIGIASSANVYAGSEIERGQVQQFIGLLTRLAIIANGAVVLVSHPSLTGIASDTGLSGNTQWHNAVRARFYLKGVKPDAGEQADTDLRELVFKKNNYGPISEDVLLRYQNGLFLPVGGTKQSGKGGGRTGSRANVSDLARSVQPAGPEHCSSEAERANLRTDAVCQGKVRRARRGIKKARFRGGDAQSLRGWTRSGWNLTGRRHEEPRRLAVPKMTCRTPCRTPCRTLCVHSPLYPLAVRHRCRTCRL